MVAPVTLVTRATIGAAPAPISAVPAPAPPTIPEDRTIVVVEHAISTAPAPPWARTTLPALWLLLAGLLALLALVHVGRRRAELRLAELETAKTQLLRVASHELRTPLTVIRGYLALAAEGELGDLPAELEEVLPAVARKSGEMADMVEKMLLAAKMDAGELNPSLIPTDLATLARRAATEVARRHPGRRIFLTVEGDAPAVAAIDPETCSQAIANLVENAALYSPADAEVVVRTRREGDYCLIEVLDQGPGVPPERRRHLFTRFARDAEGDSVTGAGLGLWLADQVAKASGGSAGYRPREEGGSEFYLRFPAAGAPGD